MANNNNNNNGQNTTPSFRRDNTANKQNNVSELDLIKVNSKEIKKELNTVFDYINNNIKSINKDINNDIYKNTKKINSSVNTVFDDLFKRLDKFSNSVDKTIDKLGTTSTTQASNNNGYGGVTFDKSIFNNAIFNNAVFKDVKINKTSKDDIYEDEPYRVKSNRFAKDMEDIKKYNESPKGSLNALYDRGSGNSLIGNWWNNSVNEQREKLIDSGKLGNTETLTKLSSIASGIKDIGSTLLKFAKPYWDKAKNSFEENYTKVAGLTSPEEAGNGGFLGINTSTDMFNEMLDSTVEKYGKTAFSYSGEMIPAMTTALERGFKGQEAIQKAQMDMESSKILPWMDTQSEAWANMSFNLDKNSLDQIRNQQLIIKQSEEGNRLLQEGIINYLTSDLGPLMSNIDSGVAAATGYKSLGEYTSLMEAYEKQGMSENDAYKAAKEVMTAQQDVYGALTSGNVNQILLGAGFAEGKGVNETVSGATAMLASGAAASNEAGDIIGGAAQANVLGFKGMLAGGWTQNANQLTAVGSDNEYVLGSTDKFDSLVGDISDYNTTDKQYKNWMENTVSDATQSIKNLPVNAISEIAGTTKAILGTLISMAITGATFGGGSGGAGGILSRLGKGILGGKAGIEAGTTTGLAGKIGAGLGRGGITAGGASSATAGLVGVAGLAGGGYMGWQDASAAIDKRKQWGVKSKTAAGIGGFFGGGEGGVENSLKNAAKWGLIGAGIGSFIPGVGTVIGGAIGAGLGGLVGLAGGDELSQMNQNIGDTFTGHASGLTTVPKDNYKASLHKGEMVVNAKTANSLRDKGITGKELNEKSVKEKINSSIDLSSIESILNTISDNVINIFDINGLEKKKVDVKFEHSKDSDVDLIGGDSEK